MSAATELVQKCINSACKSKARRLEWALIKFDRGDYTLEHLLVPNGCRLLLFSEQGSKLVHVGRRRHPLFSLGEGSVLRLQNLEIDYKGKDRFMFKGRRVNPPNVFTDNVKINRIKSPSPVAPARVQPKDTVRPDQLLEFLRCYVLAYRDECRKLTEGPPQGAGYPRSLVNRAYIDSRRLRAYILRDAVVIADVVGSKPSEGYTLDVSMEAIPAKQRTLLEDGTSIEVVTPKYSLQGFVSNVTLGMFHIVPPSSLSQFGRHGGLRSFTIQNEVLRKERRVSLIDWYPYVESSGWHPNNAWVHAFYDVRYDIAGSIATREGAGKVYKVQGGGEIVSASTDSIWHEHDVKARLGAKLERFSNDASELEKLLTEHGDSKENVFQEYLDNHPHLLDVYSTSIEPQPFLEIPEKELSTIKGDWRKPDYVARYRDGTYMLIEIERPSKPIFVGDEKQWSYELTQALNQVSTWDQIIRDFGNYLVKYPGLSNHRSMIVIGREHVRKFSTPEEFRSHLNRVNQTFNGRTRVVTFDELVERARIAIASIQAIQGSLG